MKPKTIFPCAVGISICLNLIVPTHAQEKSAAKPASPTTGKTESTRDKVAAPADAKALPRLQFLPPKGSGKAGRTEPGATRGPDARELALSVIAAKEAGLSSTAQPDLYWFVSRAVSSGVVLAIMPLGTNAIDPLFEGPLPPASAPGLQRTSLKDVKVTLVPDVEYDWSISIVTNPNSRSGDVMASGRVRHVAPAGQLQASLATASEDARAELLAANGYWYDVVDYLRRKAAGSSTEISFYEAAGLQRVVRHLKEGG